MRRPDDEPTASPSRARKEADQCGNLAISRRPVRAAPVRKRTNAALWRQADKAAQWSNQTVRLFVAIELDEAIKKMLARAQRSLSQFDRAVRWVAAPQMHLTLKFLGEVPDDRVADIHAALDLAVADCEPFEVATTAAGCFPPGGRVRTVWVGLGDASGMLARCQSKVEDALAAAGFPPEDRAFSAHLTLGRVKNDDSRGKLRESVTGLKTAAVSQQVETIRLTQSELSSKGPTYTVLGEHRLGG